ncbi:M48 family metalloprotease [Kribbella ginsengisoli]|uniref:Peptidase M48 domain-containing protein n=1 Tax=Kribbella ginsengisoli TaxID=363865 RepID=A0ABP6WQK7_9ACTN
MQTDQGTSRCPQCDHEIPTDPQYVTWCDQCDWNVDPTGPTHQVSARRRRREHRLADTLFRELEHGEIRRPGWTVARVGTYLLSTVILVVLPLAGLIGGVYALVSYRPLWMGVLLSVIPFGVTFLLRPRAHRLGPDTHVVHREQAPRLFGLVDEIAAKIGTRSVGLIELSPYPGIGFLKVGWRFTPVIRIGLPLWAGLGPQERVAVLAHELGHGKNGDGLHRWVVGSAVDALQEIQMTSRNDESDEYRLEVQTYYFHGYSNNAVNSFLDATIGSLARAVQWVLTTADLRAQQREEYLADRRSAEIAGSDAAAGALERYELGSTSYRAMEQALRFNSEADPLEAAAGAVSEIPAREVERRLRVSRLRETRSDSTHPPTNLRAKLIRTRPAQDPLVELELEESQVIDKELAGPARTVLKELRSALR